MLQSLVQSVNTTQTNLSTSEAIVPGNGGCVQFDTDCVHPDRFWDRISTIAIEGSGIPPALWSANATLLSNFHVESDGTIAHPLYDALGWDFAKFSYKANDASKAFGIGLGNWQIIIPKAKGYKYLAPKLHISLADWISKGHTIAEIEAASGVPSHRVEKFIEDTLSHKYKKDKQAITAFCKDQGIGNRAWFPLLDGETIAKICDRHGIIDQPAPDDAWQFFKSLQIPLIVTEGGKKALAGLGQGILTAAVYGNSCLRSPDLEGWQNVHIAMDQDSGFNSKGKDKRANTNAAVASGAKHLRERGVKVYFILWDPRDGKGMDDLLVGSKDKFFEAFNNPIDRLFSIADSIRIPVRADYAIESPAELEALLPKLKGLIIIDAPTGAGKTEAMRILTQDESLSHFGLTPLRSLSKGMADTLALSIFNDAEGIHDRDALCINSAFKLSPMRNYSIYFDEFESGLYGLYGGALCRKERAIRIKGFESLVRRADRVLCLSATALQKDIKKLESIKGEKAIVIRFEPRIHPKSPLCITLPNGDPGSHSSAYALSLAALESDLKGGLKAIVACDQAGSKGAAEIGLIAQHSWGIPSEQILIYCQDSLGDSRVQAFRGASDKGQWLAENSIRLFLYSPIMASGVSIKKPIGIKLFDRGYAFFNGKSIAPAQCLQMIHRLRDTIPWNICLPRKGAYTPLIRGQYKNLEDDAKYLSGLLGGGFAHDRYVLESDRQLSLEFSNFGDSFVAWAERDGYPVEIDEIGAIEGLEGQSLATELNQWKAGPIVAEGNAHPIDRAMAKAIGEKSEPSLSEALALKAFKVREYWGLPWDALLSPDHVILEGFGKGSRDFQRLCTIAFPSFAKELDAANPGEYLHDAPLEAKRSELWRNLGILEILAYCLNNPYSKNDPIIRSWWDRTLEYRSELIKFPRLLGFHFYPKPEADYGEAIKALGQILRSIGLKTKGHRSRSNGLVRVYEVDRETLQQQTDRLAGFAKGQGLEGDPQGLYRSLLRAMDQPPLIPIDRGRKGQKSMESPPIAPHPRAIN